MLYQVKKTMLQIFGCYESCPFKSDKDPEEESYQSIESGDD